MTIDGWRRSSVTASRLRALALALALVNMA